MMTTPVKDKPRRLLLVTWHDAATNHPGWAKEEEVAANEPPVVRSVGWELKRTKKRLTLVSTLITGGECSNDVVIPVGCILREQMLSVVS